MMTRLVCKLEITDWPDKTPNHIYVFDGNNSKAIGYVNNGVYQKFRAPMAIDERGRKFRKIPVPESVKKVHNV